MTDRKLVVFDFDGTLVESHTGLTESLKEFSESRNLPWSSEKMGLGYTTPLISDLGWGVSFEEQVRLLKELQKFYFDELITSRRFMPTMFLHTEEVLQELHGKYDLSIVTARDRLSLNAVLEYYNLNEYFKGYRSLTCAAERGHLIKPKPDAIYCLIKDTNHSLENIVVIGDTNSDIGMANNAGVKSIAALWGVHPVEKLQQENPTIMLENIKDLPQAIEKVFSL